MNVAVDDPPDAIAEEELLRPVRDALLADARREAAEIRSAARRAAAELVGDAEREVADAVEQERERVRRSAHARAERTVSDARRAAHMRLLAEREAARAHFVDETHAAVGRLRADARYPLLLAALERHARQQLGERADLRRDPDGRGGVDGRAGGRAVDYTLDSLADRAIAALGEEVATLWSSTEEPAA